MAKYWNIIVVNESLTVDQFIEDLGINVPADTSINFSDQFSAEEISTSYDLKQLVTDEDLKIDAGSGILSAAEGLKYITLDNIKDVRDNHYTKTESSTERGGGQFHFENVTNAPIRTQVDFKILGFYTTVGEPSGSEGDYYVNTDDGNIYKYVSSTWVSQGAPSDGLRVIDLNNATENIFEYYNSIWNDQSEADDGDLIIILDDGDGNQAGYIYDDGLSAWVKIFDYDFGTLDDAYDAGGPGAGRIIYVDAKPVKLDATGGTDSPLELTPLTNLPTTNLGGGQFAVKSSTGIPYIYDSTRSKFISLARMYACFGRQGSTKNQYLNTYTGIPSNNSGVLLFRNAVILGLSARIDGTGTCTFIIEKNNNQGVTITSIAITAGVYNILTNINIDLNTTDYLECYLSNTNPVADPIIMIELAWRE